MSEHVWISLVPTMADFVLPVETDVSRERVAVAIAAGKANKYGEPVAATSCPTTIWRKPDGDWDPLHGKPVPDVFFARSFWIVSERVAQILRQFDLEHGALYPVAEGVHEIDGKTRDPRNFYTWTFGNKKMAFIENQSPNVPGISDDEYREICKSVSELKDDDVGVSREALSGPDVWVDVNLWFSLFLSSAAGDALMAADLGEALALRRCRVI